MWSHHHGEVCPAPAGWGAFEDPQALSGKVSSGPEGGVRAKLQKQGELGKEGRQRFARWSAVSETTGQQ